MRTTEFIKVWPEELTVFAGENDYRQYLDADLAIPG